MFEIFKHNKWKILISSLLILAPIAAGLILWDKLPSEMPIHWDFRGTADSFCSRSFAVFAMPPILLALHILCIFCISLDKKNRAQNEKIFSLVLFIVPFISLLVFGITYTVSLGYSVDVVTVLIAAYGGLFMLIGNYLPKCKQNSTIGVRIKWTLENEENWYATHRFTGKIWFAGGVVLIFAAFLPDILRIIGFVIILLGLTLIPCVYSYLFYRNRKDKAK